MTKRLAIFAILLIFPAKPAFSLTGTELYRFCLQSKKGDLGDMACNGYLRGLVDGMAMGRFFEDDGRKYCPPENGLALLQARLIVEKFLRAHPELLHGQAGIVAGLALQKVFDCKDGK